jgi:hypothetical protein
MSFFWLSLAFAPFFGAFLLVVYTLLCIYNEFSRIIDSILFDYLILGSLIRFNVYIMCECDSMFVPRLGFGVYLA